MTKKQIRIGTRQSPLAMWQAELVQSALIKQGFETELVGIKTEGDVDLITPLYEMGVQGVFTKAADMALLNDQIDIAVHSLKDVPTRLATGIVQAAVLKRDSPFDILVYKNDPQLFNNPLRIDSYGQYKAVIATGSIRRKAQWLHRFPHHQIENLRGNVNTRLQKLHENTHWNGAIFAAAGLERIGLRPDNSITLDWMVPAPAQGAIVAVCRKNDVDMLKACKPLNDSETVLCTYIERDFLKTLQGGCSLPIGALAVVEGENIVFKGSVCRADGSENIEIGGKFPFHEAFDIGKLAAQDLLSRGGKELLKVLTPPFQK